MSSATTSPPSAPVAPWNWTYAERLRRLSHGGKRVVYFYETPESTTFRYRVYNVIRALEHAPQDTCASYFHFADLPRSREFMELADVLVFCRVKQSAEMDSLLSMARRRGIPVFYDVDDLVFDPRYVNLAIESLGKSIYNQTTLGVWHNTTSRMGALLRECDGAIATNEFLAQRVRDFSSKPAHVIPNFLNREQMEVSDEVFERRASAGFKHDGPPTIGYFSGTPTHNRDFGMIVHDLADVMEANPEVRLLVAGYMDLHDSLTQFKDRIRATPFTDFVNLQRVIGSVDINIAPLQDNVFTHCKSELKYFEAAAVGTVTVASPMHAFAQSVQDGVNGYLAKSFEWGPKLHAALEAVRNGEGMTMRVRAREHVKNEYGPDRQWERIERVLAGGR